MKVLITGITGFVGSHLAELYLEQGATIFGTTRWRSNLDNISHIKSKVELIECDIVDAYAVEAAIRKTEPEIIHHLAGQSYVPASWANPKTTLETNTIGTLNILEAARNSDVPPFIHVCGSSEEYGMVNASEIPIRETSLLRPLSPYAVSKVAMDLLAIQYHKSFGLDIVVSRAFNHTGPRRGDVFVCSNFAKQIALIEKKQQKGFKHGNLNAIRDFTDVRDIVKAYNLLVNPKFVGKQFNICSGKGQKISEILEILKNLTKSEIKTSLDVSRNRPSDVPVLIGDCSAFKSLTGWKPEIPIERTLLDLLNFWREKV